MSNPTKPSDDDLPAEINFSQGKRGQFYQPRVRLNLPVSLEAEVETYLVARARAKGIDVGQLVNELLKKDIRVDRSHSVAPIGVRSRRRCGR